MTEVLMKIKLTMNKEYVIPGATYYVDVTEIDVHGFHGRYSTTDNIQCNAIGLFRWEKIGHMEKINV